MNRLDVAALLEKNPQVDCAKLKENVKKIEEARKLAGKKAERPVATPYGGRRLLRDDDVVKVPQYRRQHES